MLNKASIDLIKSYEGLRLTAYLCPANIPTIGYGHTRTVIRTDVGKRTISQVEAERLLEQDLVRFENAVKGLVKVPLTSNQYGALVSFTYNLGEGNLASSTLLKRLNASDFAGASAEFAKWNKAGGKVLAGLTRRRAAEAALFRKP